MNQTLALSNKDFIITMVNLPSVWRDGHFSKTTMLFEGKACTWHVLKQVLQKDTKLLNMLAGTIMAYRIRGVFTSRGVRITVTDIKQSVEIGSNFAKIIRTHI